jgi:hypothetical protein
LISQEDIKETPTPLAQPQIVKKTQSSNTLKRSIIGSTNNIIMPKTYNKGILIGDHYTQGVEDSMKEAKKTLEELSVIKGKANIEKATLINRNAALQSANTKITAENTSLKAQLVKLTFKKKGLESDAKSVAKQIELLKEEGKKRREETDASCSKLRMEVERLNKSIDMRKNDIVEIVSKRKQLKKQLLDECKLCENGLVDKESEMIEMKREIKVFSQKEGSREKYLQTHIHLVETLLVGGRLTKLAYSPEKNKKIHK